MDEVLHLHLLELSRAEDEVAGCDLVAEGLADLRDPEGDAAMQRVDDGVEIDVDALRRLRTQPHHRRLVLQGSPEGFEHEAEAAWRNEPAFAAVAGRDCG